MKKSIIAGAGVAALGFAALPFAGVFAATSTQFTDTLTVDVQGGCTLEDATTGATPGTYVDRTFSKTIAAGTAQELEATSQSGQSTNGVTVSCNTTTGTWSVTVAVNNADGKLMSGSDFIAPLGASATMGGDTSSWAIKSNAQGTTSSNDYADYKGFVAGTFLSAAAGQRVSFNPSYKAYVATGQAVGNYTGVVTYTISL